MRAERANPVDTYAVCEGPFHQCGLERWDFVKGALWLRGLRT